MAPKDKSAQMREDMASLDPGLTPDANDGDTSRDVAFPPNAEAVRRGELSASQMGDGNIEGTDVQWPPGRIEQAGKNVYTTDDVPADVLEKSAGYAVVPLSESGEEGENPS